MGELDLDVLIIVLTSLSVMVAVLSLGFGGFAINFLLRERKLNKSIRMLEKRMEKADSILVIASDLAVSQLPAMTLTQQIPRAILNDVDLIDSLFSDVVGESVFDGLGSRGLGSRVAYARGLSKLSKKNGVSISLDRRNGSTSKAQSLLQFALERASADPTSQDGFLFDLCVRLIQAARQSNNYKLAESTLEILREELETRETYNKSTSASNFLHKWNAGLICLQKSLNSQTDRGKNLGEAVDLFARTYNAAFPEQVGVEKRYQDTIERNIQNTDVPLGSIAFYYAKSLWLKYLYDTGVNNDTSFNSDIIEALDRAIILYESTRKSRLGDLYVSAIYNYCVGFMLSIIESSEELSSLSKWAYRDNIPSLTIDGVRTSLLEASINQARLASISDGQTGRLIYTESTERLEPVRLFEQCSAKTRDASSVQDFRKLFFGVE
ncbi:MAG: hypothetical protein AAFO74_06030 [Pseudomonadota bacterium]